MKRLFAAGFLIIVSVLPARATEWLICADGEQKASFSVLMGSEESASAISSIRVEVGEELWSTSQDEGTTIVRGRAKVNRERMQIDVLDGRSRKLVAQLFVYNASEGEDYVTGGVMRVIGKGAWAVTCPNA